MIASELDVVKAPEPMPRLPVARAVGVPRPDFRRSCEAWILAGGAHHTSLGTAATAEQLADVAALTGLEFVRIGHGTDVHALKNELRWNEAAYRPH